MTAKRVVVVDDDADMRLLVKLVVESDGDRRVVAEYDACPERCETVPDVLVLDNQMRDTTGIECARRITASFPTLPIILFSAYLDPTVEHQAASVGIAACLPKDQYHQLPELIDSLVAAAPFN